MPVKKKIIVKKKKVIAPVPPLAMYRRLALGFVAFVAVLLLVVLYFSTVRASIVIDPKSEERTADFVLDIVKTPTRDSEIRGRVVQTQVEGEKSIAPSGEGKKDVEGIAKGRVTLFNTSNRSQPLVRTTRLLTTQGVLFRTDASVTVPAAGQVDVNVYADAKGAHGDLGPSSFTIPGLSESLQKVIYAKSTEPMKGGVAQVSVVSEEDLNRAFTQLASEMDEQARKILRQEVGDLFVGEAYKGTLRKQQASVKAGEEAVGDFQVSGTYELVGVFYDETALRELATLKLYDLLEQGFAFENSQENQLQSQVERFDAAKQQANVRVKLTGRIVPSLTHPELAPSKFAGKSEEEVRTHVRATGLADDVSIRFFPFWNNRVPNLADHVFVEME